MMKKLSLFILLSCVNLSCLEGTLPSVEQAGSQIGKYQIAVARFGDHSSPDLYLLDTSTGEIWKYEHNLFKENSWEKLFPYIDEER